MVEQSVTPKRRLVLHMDINNTILMSDRAKGLGTDQNLARIVCKSAWGRLHETVDSETKVKTHTWELAHDQLTFSEPESCNMLASLPALEEGQESKIATYQDWMDAQFPSLAGSATDEERAERDELRRSMQMKFAQPGGQGTKFKNTFEKMCKAVLLPKGAKDELGITGDQMDPAEPEPADEDRPEGEESEDEAAADERRRKIFEK
jgi:hypothetical protein